jgi:hypothetical protein
MKIDDRAIALMMAAVNSCETSVNIYQTTRRNILEDSHLHNRRRDNLKSHTVDEVTPSNCVSVTIFAVPITFP